MFPASTHKGHAVLSFPDVCKTPSPGGPVPISYPTMSGTTTGTKSPATKVTAKQPASTNIRGTSMSKISGDEAGSAANLKSSLSMLHQKLMAMPAGNTTAWHKILDDYVQTCANLYKVLEKK